MVTAPRSHLKFIGTAFLLAAALNLAILWEVLAQGNSELYREGQFIEVLTAGLFFCGAVVLFAACFLRQSLSRFLTVSLFTISLIAFLREVDMAQYNIPSPFVEIVSNDLKDGIFTLIVVVLVLIGLKHYRHQARKVVRALWTADGLLLLSGGLFFIAACIAELLDKKFAEELLEANAAMTFLCGCLLFALREPKALIEALADASD